LVPFCFFIAFFIFFIVFFIFFIFLSIFDFLCLPIFCNPSRARSARTALHRHYHAQRQGHVEHRPGNETPPGHRTWRPAPVGFITVKDRTLTPLAGRFIECVRNLAGLDIGRASARRA
jgi:hypothetical protein